MVRLEIAAKMTNIDYFKLICDLKENFEEVYGMEASHLIVGYHQYYDMERSESLFERFKYIKDVTVNGVVGNYIAGLRVIKTQSIEGIYVALLQTPK